MLIYNSAKEFIGIDEHDLKVLGFSNLSQLRAEAADFADLFVRTPGYIHNFQHVYWIDFVACAEPDEESKVIINVKSKSYTASLSIAKAYLTDDPSSEAYFITLNNLRALTSKESDNISSEINNQPTPVTAVDKVQKETLPDEPVVQEAFDTEDKIVENIAPMAFVEEVNKIPDTPLEIDFEEEEKIEPAPVEFFDAEPIVEESVTRQEVQRDHATENKIVDDDDDDYVFDPKVASGELGLPVDLIEEFIEDFIAQAQEFKAEMYSSLEENDINNVARLSHKLKGVAANLRIENAQSAITAVNISKDPDIIKENLDLFYRIMNKLAGEKGTMKEEQVVVALTTPAAEEVQTHEEEDDFVLDFKDDEEVLGEKPERSADIKDVVEDDFVLDFKEDTPIKDADVPDKIELPELADDDYLAFDMEPKGELAGSNQAVTLSYSKELSANAIGLDIETFEELFGDYIRDSRDISSHIHQALRENNFEKCAKEARILKGMSESMQIKEFSSELEFLINSSDIHEMLNAIKRIDKIIEQISK